MEQVTLLAAAIAGLVSFLSPCVLPLVPGYISFISGVSLEALREGKAGEVKTSRVFLSAVWFVLGFSTVFVALGASATALGSLLLQKIVLLRQAAGVIILILGLHLMGIFRIGFLQYQKKVNVRSRPLTAVGAFVVGAAFAFGWTPCIGPILAGILTLASTQETVVEGMGLLAVYSLGLGIPFLLTSLGVQRFLQFSMRFRKYLRTVEIAAGLLLVAVGVLIITDRFALLVQHMTFFNRFAL